MLGVVVLMEYDNNYKKTVLYTNASTITGSNCFSVLFRSPLQNHCAIALIINYILDDPVISWNENLRTIH